MDIILQFEPRSVYERIKALKDSGPTNEELIILRHQLKSALFSAIHNGDLFLLSPEEPNPTIQQRAYVELLALAARQTVKTIDELLAPLKDNVGIESLETKIGGLSQELVTWLQTAAKYLPATEAVMQLRTLSRKRQEYLQCLDFYYELAFYALNRKFSSSRVGIYRLREDLNALLGDYSADRHKHPLEPPIILSEIDVPHVETKAGYFSEAIIPLVQNIWEHAFKSENDINGRLRGDEFKRSYKITSSEDADKKEIVIIVSDNGFGINPDIAYKLFQEYVTTKRSSKTESGIGLRSVKDFVEKNGGRIWFETKLGVGTSFYFTIPYQAKQPIGLTTFVYRQ